MATDALGDTEENKRLDEIDKHGVVFLKLDDEGANNHQEEGLVKLKAGVDHPGELCFFS